MEQLDNRRRKMSFYSSLRSFFHSGPSYLARVVLLATLVGDLSCGNQGKAPPPPAPAEAAATVQNLLGQSDELYKQRADVAKVRQAVALLRQARVADYGNYEVAWRLAMVDHYLADHTTDEAERDEAFREGIDAGKFAVQLQPNKPEGHFWLGANYGGDAENSTLAGLANVEDIRNEMETVLKLDESFQSGSAYLGLGRLYLETPRLLGGDTEKAIGYLEKGVRVGPENALLKVTLAKAYHAARRDGDATRQIELLLKMTPHPDYVPEYNDAVRDAKKLQEVIARR